jgi:hypothetical protein
MMKANKKGTIHNATMTTCFIFLILLFSNGLVCDVYGLDFVKECKAITLEFIHAVSCHSTITKFVSMGENPHRLMMIVSSQFPSSQSV